MKYEWDENKRRSNLLKHGFDFAFANLVLEDPRSLTLDDIKHSTPDEKRMMTIGFFKDTVCVVVIHTARDKRIRIISFRHANKKEEAMLWQ